MNEKNRVQRPVPVSRLMIKDFRSIAESSVSLKPLTVIVGGNSAGKSSVLALLRLLVQAQSQQDGLQIELNGSNIELGSFGDILRRNSGTDQIEVAFRYRGRRRVPIFRRGDLPRDEDPIFLDLRLTLSGLDASTGVARIKKVIAHVIVDGEVTEALELSEVEALPATRVPNLRLRRRLGVAPIYRGIPAQFEDSAKRLAGTFRSSLSPERVENVECRFGRGGLPTELLVLATPLDILKARIPELAKMKGPSSRSVPRGVSRGGGFDTRRESGPISAQDLLLKDPSDILKLPDPLLYQLFLNEDPSTTGDNESEVGDKLRGLVSSIDAEVRSTTSSEEGVNADLDDDYGSHRQAWLTPQPQILDEIMPQSVVSLMEDLSRFLLARVEHLGPLRQGPQVLYSYGARGAATELGADARYFAFFLSRFRDTKVQLSSADGSTSSLPMIEALSLWAARLGVATNIEVRDEPGFGRRVLVTVPGLESPIDWEKVGVGVSQVLPVLARVLVADLDSVTLLEQPELHLHPEAQGTLAELLLEASRSGRQIIVETHSDAFIRRLRRIALEDSVRAAETGETHSVAEDVTFIFAERNGETGVSTLRNVELSPDGGFDEWPEGFADHSLKDGVAILSLQSRLRQLG